MNITNTNTLYTAEFDVYKEELDLLSSIVKDKMINALQLDVPIVVNINTGDNWLEAH